MATSPIDQARMLLAPTPQAGDRPWPLLGAAAFAATAAVLMAGVVVLGPGVTFSDEPPAAQQSGY